MAKTKPTFSTEFHQRVSLMVRAPEGDSHRAIALRNAVIEMGERYQTGTLNSWLIEAVLEKMAREGKGTDAQAHIAQVLGAIASQPGAESAVMAAESQREGGQSRAVAMAVPLHTSPSVEGEEKAPEPSQHKLHAGLRVM